MAYDVKSDNWIRKFDVSDPRKHKNGFTIYKVTSIVFPKSAPEASTEVIVWKRYTDFIRLHKTLKICMKQWNISENLPKLCKGRFFKRFEESIINDRINFAIELLNIVGKYQCLFTCDSFLEFFNDGYQVSDSTPGFLISPRNKNYFQAGYDLANKRNILNCESEGKTWSNESGSVSYCSDEDSLLTYETAESISSLSSFSYTKDKPGSPNKCRTADYRINNQINKNKEDDESLNLLVEKFAKYPFQNEKIDISLESIKNVPDIRIEDKSFPMNSSSSDSSEETEPFKSKKSPRLNDGLISTDPPNVASETKDCLLEAAYRVGQAQYSEAEGDFESAHSFYKSAVIGLLNISDDKESPLRKAVRNKAVRHLERAKKMRALLRLPDNNNEAINGMDDLKTYKVEKIIDSKVMLVHDATDSNYYIMKVVQKSSCPLEASKRAIIPCEVPYMVKLHKYFENENSIFLLLEHAKGGKLWDRLRSFEWPGREECEEFIQKRLCDSLENPEFSEDVATMEHSGNGRRKNASMSSITGTEDIKRTENERSTCSVNNVERDISDLEVKSLVENSQRLLDSVNKTLKKSQKLASDLNRKLEDGEAVLQFSTSCERQKKNLNADLVSRNHMKRSRSANPKLLLEKCYSLEDLSESKPRTCSRSIERRSELMKLTSFNFYSGTSETIVRNWAAEILVALETLHRYGIICRDLRPANVLLDERGNVLLSYQGCWKGVDSVVSEEAVTGFYVAPEVLSIFPITPAVDWWSFGVLLFELLTGKTLISCHPEGISGHTILSFPEFLSEEACSLLSELLRYDVGERLGSGINGSEDIKCHPFFNIVDWQMIYDNC